MKSIVTDNEKYCIICGKPAFSDHHLIFGTSGRAFSEKYGLTIPICDSCHITGELVTCRIHDNPMSEHLSKMLGQALFEREMVAQGMTKDEARQKMIKEAGRSWL